MMTLVPLGVKPPKREPPEREVEKKRRFNAIDHIAVPSDRCVYWGRK
jgi:hypothetical protein